MNIFLIFMPQSIPWFSKRDTDFPGMFPYPDPVVSGHNQGFFLALRSRSRSQFVPELYLDLFRSVPDSDPIYRDLFRRVPDHAPTVSEHDPDSCRNCPVIRICSGVFPILILWFLNWRIITAMKQASRRHNNISSLHRHAFSQKTLCAALIVVFAMILNISCVKTLYFLYNNYMGFIHIYASFLIFLKKLLGWAPNGPADRCRGSYYPMGLASC
jgi:hypothetical protein